MSIYATWMVLDEEHEEECAKWVEDAEIEGVWEIGPERTCTCGLPFAPLVYEGSHILPSNDDRKAGALYVCGIPDHITRDGRDDAPEGALKDWLRLGVHSAASRTQYEGNPYVAAGDATLVLTRPQVERLRDTLTAWLDREAI